ncbi:MAG: VCBS repeat-containing protein, partial [Verrucomicrobiota bacterium]
NTLKKDHGIRILLNRGDLKFEEAFFYPMYGAFGAVVEDFDLDGDLDVAAVAYHPDFSKEVWDNFIYLEQRDRLEFAPKFHEATQKGRWLRIAAGDVDGDGDKEILLGAANMMVGVQPDQRERFLNKIKGGQALLVLRNLAR